MCEMENKKCLKPPISIYMYIHMSRHQTTVEPSNTSRTDRGLEMLTRLAIYMVGVHHHISSLERKPYG